MEYKQRGSKHEQRHYQKDNSSHHQSWRQQQSGQQNEQQHKQQTQQQKQQPWQQNQQPRQQNKIPQQQNQQPWPENQQPWQQNQQPWQQNKKPQTQNQQPGKQHQQLQKQNQQPQQQDKHPPKYENQFQQPPPMQFLGSSHLNYRLPPPTQAPYPPPTHSPYPPPTHASHQNQMPTFQQPPPDLKSYQNTGQFSNTTSAPHLGNSYPTGGPSSSWPYAPPPDNTLPQTIAENQGRQPTGQTSDVKPSSWNASNNSSDKLLPKKTFIQHHSSTSSHQSKPGPYDKAYPPSQLQRAGQSYREWGENSQNVSQAWPSNMPPQYPPPFGGEATVERTEKEQDQQWIDNFVSRSIPSKQPTNRKCNVQIKIPQAKNLIGNYRRLLDDLKLQRDLLVENIDIDTESWQLALQQVSEIKRKLQSVSRKIMDPDFICKLTEKLKTRQKKTLNVKKRRQMYGEARQERLDKIQEVDKKMNADIAKAEKERLEKLKEKQLQKEVDTTLFEVRKKKKEADKTLEILRGLRKLRHVRKVSSVQKGVVLPISSETIFEQRITQMEQFMNRQRAVYTAEEQAMQVMLEEEQEESKEQERQMLQQKLKEKELKQLQLRRKLLFGNGKLHDPNVIPFNQFYKQTEVNIDAFLHVRYTWDQCLVLPHTDGASTIPVAWVKPEPPSTRIWKTALAD